MLDIDKTNLPKLLLWHLKSQHPDAEIRTSPSNNGYHVRHNNYCSVCENYEDPKHARYRDMGIEVLFKKKPFHYHFRGYCSIKLRSSGKWKALKEFFP